MLVDVVHGPRRRGGRASIERAGRDILHAQFIERDGPLRPHAIEVRSIAGCLELASPRILAAEPGRLLVRPLVIPRHRGQSRHRGRSGFLVRMLRTPAHLEARQIARNLFGTFAHRRVERLQFGDLGRHRIEREAVRVEGGRELRVRRDHRGAERADGTLLPEQYGRVETSPRGIRPHPRADLEVDVPVWVAGPRGLVRDRDRLELLDRHHSLRTARADARDRVLAEPDPDLGDRVALRCVESIGYLGVQCRGDRQRLRRVHDHLGEPRRSVAGVAGVAGRAHRLAGERVDPVDPLGVLVGGERALADQVAVAVDDGELGQRSAALEVVVVGAGAIGLEVPARVGPGTPVQDHSTTHRLPPS